jgi:hypothetical protein
MFSSVRNLVADFAQCGAGEVVNLTRRQDRAAQLLVEVVQVGDAARDLAQQREACRLVAERLS